MKHFKNIESLEKTLKITKEQAELCFNSEESEKEISRLKNLPEVQKQLMKINPDELKKELERLGAWDEKELENHEMNLNRIVWITCGKIIGKIK